MVNKKGWIRILEAFIAILILLSVILFVFNSGLINQEDTSGKVYDSQRAILREIQTDNELRVIIINSEEQLPIKNEDIPLEINDKIQERLPNYLECVSQICQLDDICGLVTELPDDAKEKNIYAQAIAITTGDSTFDPRQLKLFCWIK